MTCKPMDRHRSSSSESLSLGKKLHNINNINNNESSSRLGKAILAVHSKSSSQSWAVNSVSLSSSSSGFTADVSEELSHCMSAPPSLLKTEARPPPRRSSKVQRKPVRKTASSSDSISVTTASTVTTKESKSITAPEKKPLQRKKVAVQKTPITERTRSVTKKEQKDDIQNGVFNTSKLLAGASMEDFMSESQSVITATAPAARPTAASARRQGSATVKRRASYDPSKPMDDRSRNSLGIRSQGSVGATRRRPSAARKKSLDHKPTAPTTTTATQKRKSVANGRASTSTTTTQGKNLDMALQKKKKKEAASNKDPKDEKSFAEETVDGDDEDDSVSINLEDLPSLFSDHSKPKLFDCLQQSETSLQKEASLDLAKHGSVNNNKISRELRDALSRSMLDLSMQASGRERSLSPDTKRHMAPTDKTVTGGDPVASRDKPLRRKSHDGTFDRTRKPGVRRTKSDGGETEPTRGQRPAGNRRPPPNAKSMAKQRSQSLNLVGAPPPYSTKNYRRRKLHPSETSPGGTSKVSLSMSISTFDQSAKSMPSNVPRRRPPSALSGPPLRTKSSDIVTLSASVSNNYNNQKTAKRTSIPNTVTRKKRPANKQRPSAMKQKTTKINTEASDKAALSALSMDKVNLPLGKDASLLSGHIAKDSTGRNNLAVPKSQKANGPSSPFSTRANLQEDEWENDDDNDDVFSRSEVLSTTSNKSGVKPNTPVTTPSMPTSSLGVLSKCLPPKQQSAYQSYFDRHEEDVPDHIAEEFMEVAEISFGSLLTDYSEGKAKNAGNGWEEPARMTISPFSSHAGGIPSNHSTVLTSDHTGAHNVPLIPDSDDEEASSDAGSSSFHEENPGPISVEVDRGLVPTLMETGKGANVDKGQAVARTTQESTTPPQNDQIPLKESSRIAHPVEHKPEVKPRGFLWQIFCCRNADQHVACKGT